MDVKHINPFIDSCLNIMPQLGFKDIKKQGISIKEKTINSLGVMLTLGLVGDIKGVVSYSFHEGSAKNIASIMMMGLPVISLDDMAQSALLELSNMLTANASTNFSRIGINVNISTPTLMYGGNFQTKTNIDKILCINVLVDDMPMEINIAFENI
nr:chemotaxis protein CheX [Streptococcus dysgalactiae]WCE85759.1 chemotaxis protein CheX [Streptococcus dysgalactiae]WCN25757.1 chemotaxis protein CheX [Streptococcus dysgalactiae]